MPAAGSSSSKPEPVVVTASISLDGVLLECSEPVQELGALAERPWDILILTIHPKLLGKASAGQLLSHSHRFTLVDHAQVGDRLELTYKRSQLGNRQPE